MYDSVSLYCFIHEWAIKSCNLFWLTKPWEEFDQDVSVRISDIFKWISTLKTDYISRSLCHEKNLIKKRISTIMFLEACVSWQECSYSLSTFKIQRYSHVWICEFALLMVKESNYNSNTKYHSLAVSISLLYFSEKKAKSSQTQNITQRSSDKHGQILSFAIDQCHRKDFWQIRTEQ